MNVLQQSELSHAEDEQLRLVLEESRMQATLLADLQALILEKDWLCLSTPGRNPTQKLLIWLRIKFSNNSEPRSSHFDELGINMLEN